MTEKRIKRDSGAVFINMGTAESRKWERVGRGMASLQLSLNPATEDIQDIDMQTATTVANGVSPQMSLTPTVVVGNAVNDYLRSVCDEQKLSEQKEIMFVDTFVEPVSNAFPARVALFNLIPQSGTGGDAGSSLGYGIDLHQEGELIIGTAKLQDNAWVFTANA